MIGRKGRVASCVGLIISYHISNRWREDSAARLLNPNSAKKDSLT